MSLQSIIQRDFNKAKKEATRMIENNFNTKDLISDIKRIRLSVNQGDRAITKKDIVQHLAIRIYKEKYAI